MNSSRELRNSVRRRRVLRRGVYIIPSAFTIGNIFCGFYAVLNSMMGYKTLSNPDEASIYFDHAAIAIGIAYLLDGLDGRIARMTGATSEFGVELDSIADVLSFGIAPAVLAYSWGYGSMPGLERWAWVISFFFLICGALRLARFNVLARAPRFDEVGTTPKLDKRYFVGLPIPGAAGLIAAIVHFLPLPITVLESSVYSVGMLVVMAILALLMVSTFRYASFKNLGPRSNHPFFLIPLLAAVIIGIVMYSQWMLLLMAIAYTTHGPLLKIWGLLNRSRRTTQNPDTETASHDPA
ncbi:MAG TPA: CDP-diacylglycerol--serine O-phosphatidyltransferase, partial [Blastocatellia bacterium]|nr:CDP-diacylglycerol--serine O-phosphatidyltransferase [Blastocatellia bacterium]